MAIQINKRPFYYSFSGNPLHYQLFSAAAAANTQIYFELKVVFISMAGVKQETATFPYVPINGYADADVQEIVEGFLEYDLPLLTGPAKAVHAASRQTGWTYIAFREVTTNNSNTAPWDESEADFQCLVVKGGISRFKYQGNNFFANYFNVDVPMQARPFLTWQKRGRFAGLDERMYLPYLHIEELTDVVIMATVTYTDGTWEELTESISVEKNTIYHLPAGAGQWGFSRAKQIWYWEVVVKDFVTGAPTFLSEAFRYQADNRKDYNDTVLHYRGSLGGLDSVAIRGVINFDLEYDFMELQNIQRPNYYDGHFFDPQRQLSNSWELQTKRGDIGHLTKEEQDRLRDQYTKRESWQAVGSKWVPVIVLTKTIKQKDSNSNRWSLPIDFALAHEGDSHYTPESVELGEGTFTNNVCRATVMNLQVKLFAATDPTKRRVEVTLTENDPDNASTEYRYRVITRPDSNVAVPWTRANYNLQLSFELPADTKYLLEAQAICGNGIYGKKETALFNTAGQSGGGTANSRIFNNSATTLNLSIVRNGTEVFADFVKNGVTGFDITSSSNSTILVYIGGYNATSVTLSDGTAAIQGQKISGSPAREVWQWQGINVINGIFITID